MFDDQPQLDMYDFARMTREHAEEENLDMIEYQRGIKGGLASGHWEFGEEVEWFHPIVISKEFLDTMDDRELVQYLISQEMTAS